MSLRQEFRSRERPLPDLEAEREVDVGQIARQVAARWWLLVAGLVAGMVVGYLVALGGGDFYEAEATLYLGQPFSPTAQAPVPSLATNPTAVRDAVHSEAVLREAAERSGMSLSELRGNVSTSTTSGSILRRTPGVTPLVKVSVQGEQRREVTNAANALATVVVEGISAYPDVKIDSYTEQLVSQRRQLDSLDRRIALQNEAIERAADEPPLDQLVLISQLDNLEQQRAVIEQDRQDTRALLALARDVERPRIYQRALAVETSARSTRNSVIVGGLIGLILGAFAALLWEPVLERRFKRARR
jgi:capsular polysaccharide biosynthesis protein